jgi:UDPglucose--hexose-1-phosphate uridylyltransferase
MEYRPKKALDVRECPFCEGKESMTTSEVFAIRSAGSAPNGPGWEVRSIVSKMPILSNTANGHDSRAAGIYDTRDGVGQHEIIVETPKHQHDLDEFSLKEIEGVLKAYAARIAQLSNDSRFEYALLFKNHGLVSGAATDVIRHSRSQLLAMPIIPKRTKEELALTKSYYERRERCVVCDILKQESSEGTRVVVENASFFAYCPFASRSPFEMWVLPKKHSADFASTEGAAFADLAWVLKQCLVKLNRLLDDPPHNLILHTAPFRHKKKSVYWKTIEDDYHWYWQIMPRLTLSAGFEWGTGIHINPTPPEEAAALLRDTPTEE